MNFNKFLMLPAFTFVAGLLLTASAWAQSYNTTEYYPKWHVSAYGGGFWPDKNHLDDTAVVGGRITRNINEQLEGGLDISWKQYDDDFNGVKIGEAREIPILAILKYNFPMADQTNAITPYLIGGLGVSYWNYDEDFDTIDADDDASFTALAGLGFDYQIQENFGLFLEGGYNWSEYDIDGSVNNVSVDESTKADGLYARAGVEFSF